jgi:hypothetical protein
VIAARCANARALVVAAALTGALVSAVPSRDAMAQGVAGAADATDAEPLGLDYAAPDGCPAAGAFFAEIVARTPRARAARYGEKSRVLHVRLSRAAAAGDVAEPSAGADAHVGTLAIEDTTGTGSARSMSGGTCAEVAGALALVAALAVDPRADVAPRPPASPSTPASAPASPSTPASASAPAPAATPARRAHLSLGTAGELAMIADAVASLRLFGELELARDEDPSDLFAPSFRLALSRSFDRDRTHAATTATLLWTQASLDVCPIRLAVGAHVALRPCGSGSAGVLQADALVSRTRPWATLGAHGRAVWAPIGWLAFDIEVGAIAPLYRESFFFEPSIAVYERTRRHRRCEEASRRR